MRGRTAVFVVLIAAVALVTSQTPEGAGELARDAQVVMPVRAGAAAVDITPLPGLPTAGHGPLAGAIARGYWDRLRATAFYFEDPAGRGFALVSADLFGIPTALHQSVAAHFSAGNPENLTRVELPPERVAIAATHTHQGPANYLSAELYNNQASKQPGFNPALRAFLRQQFIRAIELAIADARAATGSSIEVQTGRVDGTLFLNRSPKVFMEDGSSSEVLDLLGAGLPATGSGCVALRQPKEPQKDWEIAGCPRLRAVDRNVSIVRIRRSGRTHAMALFLNVHPTVVPAATPLYTGDLFGIARSSLESAAGDPAPVIGFFNGSEGDVVTRRTTRTAVNLHELGSRLAAQIKAIHDREPAVSVDLTSGIAARLHYAHPGERVTTADGIVKLASQGMVGVATLGGGEGDPSGVVAIPTTRKPTGDHGVKVPALGLLQGWIAPPRAFPQALPLGYVRLGSLALVLLPTETSTAAVWQIRRALGGAGHGTLEMISMTNEYASYLTTRDEYQIQDYMGASTLWGPEESAFFAAALARAAGEQGAAGLPGPDAPGAERAYPLGQVGLPRPNARSGYDDFLRGGAVLSRDLPAFDWCGPAPTTIALPAHRAEVVAVTGAYRDRSGVAVVLRRAPKRGQVMWGALWLTPLWEARPGRYFFRVTDGARTISSQPFEVGSSPSAACDAR